MEITFKHSYVEALTIEGERLLPTNYVSDSDEEFDMKYTVAYDESNDARFAVLFDLKLKFSNDYALRMTYIAQFETSTAITDDFKNSHFPVINAPAIAYPYLRSYISNLTLSSGHVPVILPTVNFTKYQQNP